MRAALVLPKHVPGCDQQGANNERCACSSHACSMNRGDELSLLYWANIRLLYTLLCTIVVQRQLLRSACLQPGNAQVAEGLFLTMSIRMGVSKRQQHMPYQCERSLAVSRSMNQPVCLMFTVRIDSPAIMRLPRGCPERPGPSLAAVGSSCR